MSIGGNDCHAFTANGDDELILHFTATRHPEGEQTLPQDVELIEPDMEHCPCQNDNTRSDRRVASVGADLQIIKRRSSANARLTYPVSSRASSRA